MPSSLKYLVSKHRVQQLQQELKVSDEETKHSTVGELDTPTWNISSLCCHPSDSVTPLCCLDMHHAPAQTACVSISSLNSIGLGKLPPTPETSGSNYEILWCMDHSAVLSSGCLWEPELISSTHPAWSGIPESPYLLPNTQGDSCWQWVREAFCIYPTAVLHCLRFAALIS